MLETIVPVDGVPMSGEPKTARGRRTIPLGPLVDVLRAHQAAQKADKLKAPPGTYDERGYVVADELGRPWHPDNFSAAFRQAVQDVEGLKLIRLHDCRHTAASHLLRRGVPVNVVAEILGIDPAVLLRTYAQEIVGQKDEAVAGQVAAFLA